MVSSPSTEGYRLRTAGCVVSYGEGAATVTDLSWSEGDRNTALGARLYGAGAIIGLRKIHAGADIGNGQRTYSSACKLHGLRRASSANHLTRENQRNG